MQEAYLDLEKWYVHTTDSPLISIPLASGDLLEIALESYPLLWAMGSPVVDEWEKLDYIVSSGQKGELVQFANRPPKTAAHAGENKQVQIFNRRDVINNAPILGPLILHMGT